MIQINLTEVFFSLSHFLIASNLFIMFVLLIVVFIKRTGIIKRVRISVLFCSIFFFLTALSRIVLVNNGWSLGKNISFCLDFISAFISIFTIFYILYNFKYLISIPLLQDCKVALEQTEQRFLLLEKKIQNDNKLLLDKIEEIKDLVKTTMAGRKNE